VWNQRSRRAFEVFQAALGGVRARNDYRVSHYSVQGNHLHLLVEARSISALTNGMRALTGRIARGLNRLMARTGPVFADRYHAHVLRTPAEVRNALRYVLGNHESHAARRGEPVAEGYVDPYASVSPRQDAQAQGSFFPVQLTTPAKSWLMRRARIGAEAP
jgi:REP element-mobilizing transposase RayT